MGCTDEVTLLCACKQTKKVEDFPPMETGNRTNKVVDFPLVGTANTTDIVIERVEQTDSVTLLTMRGFGLSGRWIKITPETHLVAEGKEYKLKGSQNIVIGEPLVIPEDGDTCFILSCEPLPMDCKRFDYIGGEFEQITILDKSDVWKLYDIDLTGKTGGEYPDNTR